MSDYRNEMNQAISDGKWTFGKLFPLFILLILIVGAAFWLLGIGAQPAAVVSKTLNANNMIANYEFFKQQHEDIKAIDNKIVQAEAAITQYKEDAGPRADWGFQDKEHYNRLNTVHLGLKHQRESMVAEYNAKSKMQNRSLFKDASLPYQIN